MLWKISVQHCNYRSRCLFTLIALLIVSKWLVRRCFFALCNFLSLHSVCILGLSIVTFRTCFFCVFVCSVSSCSPFQQMADYILLDIKYCLFTWSILCSLTLFAFFRRKTLMWENYKIYNAYRAIDNQFALRNTWS